jgi:hypothetical protein
MSNNQTQFVISNKNNSDSISENIQKGVYIKKDLPSLSSNSSQSNKKTVSPKNMYQQSIISANLDTLINKIDNMDNHFDEPEQISNVEEINDEELEKFKHNVKNWIEYDNQILKLDNKRKELIKQRNSYNELITKFMKSYKVDDLNIDNGEKLKYQVKQTKGAFNKKSLESNLQSYFTENIETAKKLFAFLDEKRTLKETETIKRVKSKV